MEQYNREEFKRIQTSDPELEVLFQKAREDKQSQYVVKKELLYRRDVDKLGEIRYLLVVPKDLRRKVFNESHSSPLAVHTAYHKTKDKAARCFYWPAQCN